METTKKTAYQWCVEANIRVLDLNEWPENYCGSNERCYFEQPYSKEEFIKLLSECRVKSNSTPRKTEMYLEYRMYGLVNYQFCNGSIHAGIQFSHALADYGRMVRDISPYERIYNKWADEDKTVIILNGGTTNTNPDKLGTLNQHLITLKDNGVICQDFYEPDLNDALTAICFLVSELVYNRDLYPDYVANEYPWNRKAK